MRNVLVASVVAWAVVLTGCSKDVAPVVVTPEVEAEQKQAEKDTREAELARQKEQRIHRDDVIPADGELEERERLKQRRAEKK